MVAVEHMMRAFQTFQYKHLFDEAYVSRQYDKVTHTIIKISHVKPTVAVCSLFPVDGVSKDDDCVRVALNVIPIDEKGSIAVFSHLPEDAELVKSAFSLVFASEGCYQKYLLSKTILNKCENFVISPAYYDTWSSHKVQAIIDYFTRTLFKSNFEIENEHLYLF
jgi:hypothetical protein